jgi:aerobic-type carbon monoxide dehydrogenase small subunit (CoxS/CutS family)
MMFPDRLLDPLQRAFIEHDGFQCGYCTPGQICSAIGLFAEWRRGVPSAVTRTYHKKKLNLRMTNCASE